METVPSKGWEAEPGRILSHELWVGMCSTAESLEPKMKAMQGPVVGVEEQVQEGGPLLFHETSSSNPWVYGSRMKNPCESKHVGYLFLDL